MTLAIFLAVTVGAAGIALLSRAREGVSVAVGLVGLLAAVIAALALDPRESIVIGGATLAASAYVRLFLVFGSVVGLGLALVGLAAGSRRDVPAATLGTLGASAIALSLPDPRVAVIAATAGGLLGVLLSLSPAGGRAGATVGIRVLRALVVAGAMAIAATAWIGRDLSELAAQPVVFGLAYLAFALAVAIRFGAIPFHVWAARLTNSVPETALPVVTAWGPAAFAVVALTWTDASIAPLLPIVDMGTERTIILVVGIVSIVLAALAAWIQDDLEHVVGYSIIGDAGVVLLALATLQTDAWEPARVWILAYVVARSAFAAWAGAMRATYVTSRIGDLRGWALRSPVLGLAFGVIVVASIGLPGLAAYDARSRLVDLALDGPVEGIVFVAMFAPLLYYGRLAAIGLMRPDPGLVRDRAMAGLPRRTPVDLTDIAGSIRAFWAGNRAASALAVTLLMATMSLAVTAGGFEIRAAAAGFGPSPEGPSETVGPGPVDGGSDVPSFEPVPSGS